MYIGIKEFYNLCDGIEEKEITSQFGGTYFEYYYTDNFKLPSQDIFIEITATSTKGTIGKLIDIELDVWTDKTIGQYGTVFILEVEGRNKPCRIKWGHANILIDYTEQTKYVRNVKTRDKAKVKNPVNKFNQELKRGDWIIGVGKGNVLKFGRVTRWTNHNVWATFGNDLDDKSGEFQLEGIKQTFLLPNDDLLEDLTFATLQGWDGN